MFLSVQAKLAIIQSSSPDRHPEHDSKAPSSGKCADALRRHLGQHAFVFNRLASTIRVRNKANEHRIAN